ncbi:SymE family type I addiction module toxin [Burkholderia gladioli]|uniref:SymE family type I addiction module toxin n=1 Tax=Burkholderia gladioli TaxID=28095 RepID=UPI0016414BE4|nr:SymE family type I addiction module toxin [Burkholderia gladioli]
MAEKNHNAPNSFPDRSVTIRESWRYLGELDPKKDRTEMTTFPWMRLAGYWLEEAGFIPGHRARIKVTMGQLITTPIDESEVDITRHGILSVDQTTGVRRRMKPRKKIAWAGTPI